MTIISQGIFWGEITKLIHFHWQCCSPDHGLLQTKEVWRRLFTYFTSRMAAWNDESYLLLNRWASGPLHLFLLPGKIFQVPQGYLFFLLAKEQRIREDLADHQTKWHCRPHSRQFLRTRHHHTSVQFYFLHFIVVRTFNMTSTLLTKL